MGTVGLSWKQVWLHSWWACSKQNNLVRWGRKYAYNAVCALVFVGFIFCPQQQLYLVIRPNISHLFLSILVLHHTILCVCTSILRFCSPFLCLRSSFLCLIYHHRRVTCHHLDRSKVTSLTFPCEHTDNGSDNVISLKCFHVNMA